MAEIEWSQCQDCGLVVRNTNLKPVKNLLQRVEPGEPMPSGECPECGALCQPDLDVVNSQFTIGVSFDIEARDTEEAYEMLYNALEKLPSGWEISWESDDDGWFKDGAELSSETCSAARSAFFKRLEPWNHEEKKTCMQFKTYAEAQAFMDKEYGHLSGCRLVGIEPRKFDTLGRWHRYSLALTFELEDGRRETFAVMADAEGNGPGFLASQGNPDEPEEPAPFEADFVPYDAD